MDLPNRCELVSSARLHTSRSFVKEAGRFRNCGTPTLTDTVRRSLNTKTKTVKTGPFISANPQTHDIFAVRSSSVRPEWRCARSRLGCARNSCGVVCLEPSTPDILDSRTQRLLSRKGLIKHPGIENPQGAPWIQHSTLYPKP